MNFSLLQEKYPMLQVLGQEAENAMHQDAMVYYGKLLCFGEAFVNYLYDELNLPKQEGETLEVRVSQSDFVDSVPKEIVNKLRLLQLYGDMTMQGAVQHLLGWHTKRGMKDAYLLGRWLFKLFVDCEREYPPYVFPMLSESPEPVAPIDVQKELYRIQGEMKKVHSSISYTMTPEERKECNREYRSEGIEVLRQDSMLYEGESTEQCIREVQAMIGTAIREAQMVSSTTQVAQATGESVTPQVSPTIVQELQAVDDSKEVPVDDFLDDNFVQRRVLTPWHCMRETGQAFCRLLVRMLGARYYTISHIVEHDYQIVFTVQGDAGYGSYMVYYKKNGKVSRVLPQESTLDEELDVIIMGLEGCSIFVAPESPTRYDTSQSTSRDMVGTRTAYLDRMIPIGEAVDSAVDTFTYPKGPVGGIKVYMKWIEEELSPQAIRIVRMEQGQFHIRTTFAKGREVAVFNLYYNRLGQMTRAIPLESKSTSLEFVETVLDIISPNQMSYWVST
ncbi:hypothetical protein [Veillonella sp. VA139]|uniref:hypothetical protein n=1 Tax=Veillonella sp. VA139 TaxID=741830 RepID=UPI000F8D88CC|nr:hypothetical protein [Veillonella sp. VA139]